MTINIEWDRTDGVNAKGRVVAVILDSMETEPTLFEIKAAIEQALEKCTTWAGIQTIRLDPPSD